MSAAAIFAAPSSVFIQFPSNKLLTALQGKVHAKSGTIESVKCYAGYLELKNRTLVFAILVNNPDGTHKQVIKKMEDFLLDIMKDLNK